MVTMDELTVGTRVDHPRYGEGIVSKNNITAYEIFFERGGKIEISKRNTDLSVIKFNEETKSKNGISLKEVEEVITYVMDKYNGLSEIVELADKWQGGTLELKPSNPSLKAKEVPIEAFFRKIIMVRDRLRVLEQNINSNKSLPDKEKINIQQYITRAYGSLTTFNVLFADKEDYFVGVKS
ncbi:hypothetical protein MNBD_BACTEROID01-2506 [hydrothermal vent metagenome]|uniref:Uncharacterized protein n=1 Tax=hydrothermal vent metagenome TaxID=652676 RepID=A0A3B0UK62_9ZZZZ